MGFGGFEGGDEVDAVVDGDVGGDEGVCEQPEEHKDTENDGDLIAAAFLFGTIQHGGARGFLDLSLLAVFLAHLVEAIFLVLVVVYGEGNKGDEPEELEVVLEETLRQNDLRIDLRSRSN